MARMLCSLLVCTVLRVCAHTCRSVCPGTRRALGRSRVNRGGRCHRPWLCCGSLGLKNPRGYRCFGGQHIQPYSHTYIPYSRGCRNGKKKLPSVQYVLQWRLVGNQWRLVGNRWRLVGNRWRLVGNRWRLVGNRWWLVGNRWRLVGNRRPLVGSHQTSESGCHSRKKKGERPYGTPCHTGRRSVCVCTTV